MDSVLAAKLRNFADKIDERMGPIDGRMADQLAVILRATTESIVSRDERIAALEYVLSRLLSDKTGIHPMFGGVPTIRDLCYTAFQIAKSKNTEDGGNTDWFTDTLPMVEKGIEAIRARTALADKPVTG